MTLVADWKRILRKAWSIRLLLLAGLLSGIEVMLPFYDGSMPRGWFAALSGLTVAGAFVARIVAQPRMYEPEARNEP